MAASGRFHFRPVVPARFELGDRVIVRPGSEEGVVIGVRYGEIAYDVLCAATRLRNIPADRLRLARAHLSVVA